MALLIGAVYASTDDRTVAHPILRPGGRVGRYQLVERVQSLPASYSLPPPRMDPQQSKLEGGAAAWLNALALPDAETTFNETNNSLALPDLAEGGLALPEAFSARQGEGLFRSLPAPVPSAAFEPLARGLPKPFEEELESIAANRRYRLHRRVSRGAHGEVWRAVRSDDSRGTPLILKRLHAGSSGLLAGLRERHFGERLKGVPHIARFRDAFEHDGSLWLVFVDEGFSLHDLLYTSSREAGGAAVVVQPSRFWLQMRQDHAGGAVLRHVIRQALQGLANTHALNITHRDLKPSNVIVCSSCAAPGPSFDGDGAAGAAGAAGVPTDGVSQGAAADAGAAGTSHARLTQRRIASGPSEPSPVPSYSPQPQLHMLAAPEATPSPRTPSPERRSWPLSWLSSGNGSGSSGRGGGSGGGSGGGGGGDGGGGRESGGGAQHEHAESSLTMVRLADFGSAVDAQTLQPNLGLYPGIGPSVAEETREYQPPEASLGGLPYAASDPRSYDLWSMGVTVLEILLATPHPLPLSARAEATLRMRFANQPAEVLERLRLANALAEFCIKPPSSSPASAVAAAATAATVADGAGVHGLGHGTDGAQGAGDGDGVGVSGAGVGVGAAGGEGAKGQGGGGAACGREQFIAALRKQDPLASLGLELDESLLDLAWRLLRWQPEQRMSAEEALRHPALAPVVEAASEARELVRHG